MAKLVFQQDFRPKLVLQALAEVARALGGSPPDVTAELTRAGSWSASSGDTELSASLTDERISPVDAILKHRYELEVGGVTASVYNESFTDWLGQIDVVLKGETEAQAKAAHQALVAFLPDAKDHTVLDPPPPEPPRKPPIPTQPLSGFNISILVLIGTIEQLEAYLKLGIAPDVFRQLGRDLAKANRADLIEVLLAHGVTDEVREEMKRGAQLGGRTELLKRLSEGTKPTPAQFIDACMQGSPELVQSLIEMGADLECELPVTTRSGAKVWYGLRRDGWTPLTTAIHHGRPEIAKVLLAAGANPNRLTRSFRMPLDAAKFSDQWPVHAEILAAGGRPVADDDLELDGAVARGMTALAEQRLAEADAEQRRRAFRVAVLGADGTWAERLWDDGAVDALLTEAVSLGAIGALRLLLPRIDLAGQGGALLQHAIDEDRDGSVTALREAGVDVFETLLEGETPLQYAQGKGARTCIRLLKRLNAERDEELAGPAVPTASNRPTPVRPRPTQPAGTVFGTVERPYPCSDHRLLFMSQHMTSLLMDNGVVAMHSGVDGPMVADLADAICSEFAGLNDATPGGRAGYASAEAEQAAVAQLTELWDRIQRARKAGRECLQGDARAVFERIWCELEYPGEYVLEKADVQARERVQYIVFSDIRHQLPPHAFEEGMKMLARLDQARLIALYYNDLRDAELAWAGFEGLKQLRGLDLSQNQLQTVPIASASLEFLDLTGNPLTGPPDLDTLPALKALGLKGTGLDRSVVDALRKARKGLEVFV